MAFLNSEPIGGSLDSGSEIKVKGSKLIESDDFDRSKTEKINPLVKMEVINKKYNLGRMLKDLGYDTSGSNMYCPFHPDEMTGKPSAKYHADSDKLYCFSENKSYSAYHGIKILYGLNVDKVFLDIWSNMSLDERHEIMDKYESSAIETRELPKIWKDYRGTVLDMFRQGKVTLQQHKNALYKVLSMIRESDESKDSNTD